MLVERFFEDGHLIKAVEQDGYYKVCLMHKLNVVAVCVISSETYLIRKAQSNFIELFKFNGCVSERYSK